jgi:hypothetical protein
MAGIIALVFSSRVLLKIFNSLLEQFDLLIDEFVNDRAVLRPRVKGNLKFSATQRDQARAGAGGLKRALCGGGHGLGIVIHRAHGTDAEPTCAGGNGREQHDDGENLGHDLDTRQQ